MVSRNYKVSATVGVSTVVATPVFAILDTGAGPNLVREDVLPEDWLRYRVAGDTTYQVIGAGGRSLPQRGVVTLWVQLGRLRAQARFIVVKNLAAACILGCQFIDRHVKSIHPKEKRVLLNDGTSVAILHAANPPAMGETEGERGRNSTPSTKIRIARFAKIPARSESLVEVQCDAPGLRFLQGSLRHSSMGVYMANGLAEILPNRIFRVRVVNASLTDRLLPKGMILGYAMLHPTGIVSLVEQEEEKVVRSVPTGLQVALSPEAYAMGMDPPPLPDRPDVDGMLWKQEVDLAHLMPQEREKVLAMLSKHRTMWDGRLGQVHSTAHRIQLIPGAKPAYSQPYRAGTKAREAESSEIHRMLRAGVIEPATSEWASPVVLVPKPDGSMRFCIDYRRLNTVTVRDSYPLPRMDECIDSLGDARVFSTLDCNSGYWQIPVSPADKEKTTFTSHEGLFQFLRMPFGLKNAPATFQRFVDITLAGLTWKVCLVYLDDIIVYSRSREDHLAHLDEVLHRLYRAGLSLNLKKCHFFRSEVSYLGHVIGPGTLSVSEKNTRALRTAKPPTTQTELRSFLGLCNVYRRFVCGFAKIAAPLNALLKKGESPQLRELTETQLRSFEILRECLLNPPILALPRTEGKFILDTDASSEQIGCCLFQEHDDKEKHPLGYWSRGLTSAEKNYSTTEKECLAIVWAVLHLRPYLEGKRFTIRTDHHSLRWVLNLADAQGRLARWRLRLQEFDFEVLYLPGRSHHGADMMSRLQSSDPTLSDPTDPVDTDIPCFSISHRNDPTLVLVDYLLEHQRCDPQYDELMTHWGWSESMDMDPNGVIGYVCPTGEFEVIIPDTIPTGDPITIIDDVNLPQAYESTAKRDGDVTVLRRGVTFSPLISSDPTSSPLAFDTDLALATDEIPREISLSELRYEQANDPEIADLLTTGRSGRSPVIDVNDDGIAIRKAPLDGCEQILVPLALRPRVLYLEHYPKSVGHPGVTKMFRSMRQRYFWRNMYREIEDAVRSCEQCARNNVQERSRVNNMQLFTAQEPLEFVAIDILGPLPKTAHGNRFLLVISDRFSKLTRTIPMRTTTALAVAKAFCTHWVFSYGPPRYLLSDNGTQFTAKFFLEVCRELGIAKVFTTAYHPQTNGQVERFNRTILNALRAYVAKSQADWDDFTSAITYGYNSRIHASLGFAPFELVLSRPPPPLAMEQPIGKNYATPEDEKRRFVHRLKELVPLAKERLVEAQRKYKENFDKNARVSSSRYCPDSWVFLRKESPNPEGKSKLDEIAEGPYRVIKSEGHTLVIRIGEDDVRVSATRVTRAPRPQTETLPHGDHLVDSHRELRNVTSDPTPTEIYEPEYVMDKIVGLRKADDGTWRYRVRWYGYAREDDTWEPADHIPDNVIRRYHRRVGLPLGN